MGRLSVISRMEEQIKSQANFMQQLHDLDKACWEIEQYFHEYDYSKEKPGNGFRSIVKITDIYFQKLDFNQQGGNLSLYPDLLQEFILLAKTLSLSLSYAQLLRKKGVNFDATVQSEIDLEFFSRILNAPVECSEPIFGSIGTFHYKGSPGPIVHCALFLLHLWSFPSQSLRMLFDSKFTIQRMAQSAAATPLSLVKAMIPGPTASMFWRPLMRLACFIKSAHVTELLIPSRTNEWTISVPDWKKPAIVEKTGARHGSCRSLLVRPFHGRNESKSIMIHTHGGAFITNTADIFSVLAAILASKFGIPVILPDYRKAPEDKYPAGLQDVLDLYLFLTSGDPEVEQMIGFQPEHVYMAGDSAGANLTIGTTFVLNYLRKKGERIRMPEAITVQYPAVCATFGAMPSHSVLLLDSVLARGMMCLAGAMYTDIEPAVTDDTWHLESEEKTMQIIASYGCKLKDPLINLLAFRDWDDLKDIPLSIAACEMDPTLDGAIMLAKAWKGEVAFDIVQRMPHGYSGFALDPFLAPEMAVYQQQIADAIGFKMR